MIFFWDSSAFLPLLFQEKHSDRAVDAWEAQGSHFAWKWMEVETHSAVVRRRSIKSHLQDWRTKMDEIIFLTTPADSNREIMTMNEHWALRSADAGHVYVLNVLRRKHPGVVLVTFDAEMIRLARKNSWSIWE